MRKTSFPAHQSHLFCGKTVLGSIHGCGRRWPGIKLKTVEKPSRPIALTIAGFDPSSGAGITADLKTFAAHGVYGMACISALTVQSTQGVRRVEGLRPDLVRQTLDCLAEDVAFTGVKIGMLGSAEVAAEVSAFLASQPAALRRRTVLDPVLRSSSGLR